VVLEIPRALATSSIVSFGLFITLSSSLNTISSAKDFTRKFCSRFRSPEHDFTKIFMRLRFKNLVKSALHRSAGYTFNVIFLKEHEQ